MTISPTTGTDPRVTPHHGPRPAVQLLDVHKSYARGPGTVPALRGVSLSLTAGSFVSVMGPSGSGKSTLLHCAAGLDSPTRGRVVIGEHDISAFSDDALTRFRRDQVGFVFQSYNLIGHLSVADNISLPLVLGGRELDPVWRADLVAAIGLDGLLDRRPGELSGGQAQRVAIARALVTRPTVVFADEPTGALDSRTASDVLDVFRRTAARLGQTVVLVTHDPRVAAVSDRVVFLADGVVADDLGAPTVDEISSVALGLGR